MTALARTLRSTAFRLTLVIFGFGAVGAGLVLGLVAFQVIELVDRETRAAISAEAESLVELYQSGGLRRLGITLAERARAPAGSIYLLTDSLGEPLVGNISQLPPDLSPKSGFGETRYQTLDGVSKRRALARVYGLPNGFRLLIGHDLGDRARIGAVMVRTLALSLVLFAGLAALGALFVARRVLRRIDAMNVSARALMAGDMTERLPVSGSGDELDRLRHRPQRDARPHRRVDGGPARGLRQHRPRPAHAADAAAQPRRGGAEGRRRQGGVARCAVAHDREPPHQRRARNGRQPGVHGQRRRQDPQRLRRQERHQAVELRRQRRPSSPRRSATRSMACSTLPPASVARDRAATSRRPMRACWYSPSAARPSLPEPHPTRPRR